MTLGSMRVAAPATSLGGAWDVDGGLMRSDILRDVIVVFVYMYDVGMGTGIREGMELGVYSQEHMGRTAGEGRKQGFY